MVRYRDIPFLSSFFIFVLFHPWAHASCFVLPFRHINGYIWTMKCTFDYVNIVKCLILLNILLILFILSTFYMMTVPWKKWTSFRRRSILYPKVWQKWYQNSNWVCFTLELYSHFNIKVTTLSKWAQKQTNKQTDKNKVWNSDSCLNDTFVM